METHKSGFAFCIHETESMDAKTFHRAVTARNAPVRHRPEHVMQGFRLQGHVIPEGIVRTRPLRDFVMRFGFYRMHKIREFMGILNKEHRCIVTDQVVNAFIGIKLGRPAADITHGICRTAGPLNGRETHKYRRFLFRIRQEAGFGHRLHTAIGLEITVRRSAPRMNDTFGNALMVEVSNFFTENEIFKQCRATISGFQRVLIIRDFGALIGGQRLFFTIFAVAF
ncbi:hypothetical protein SRABI106_01769 [Rahnella aquatilis]|nr:hypothetical protein SRABI106_01769 [Rahnella aquatilis]